MGKNAPALEENIFYRARKEASRNEPCFESREKASERVLIEKTRLAKIESGKILPHPEEVRLMASAYNAPELCNAYCAGYCPVGIGRIAKSDISDLDRIALRVLGSIHDTEALQGDLISIVQDGQITPDEYEKVNAILIDLDKIASSTQALKLWVEKNIGGQKQ